jgi:hypothetical protein
MRQRPPEYRETPHPPIGLQALGWLKPALRRLAAAAMLSFCTETAIAQTASDLPNHETPAWSAR